jgi:hypothetical protein
MRNLTARFSLARVIGSKTNGTVPSRWSAAEVAADQSPAAAGMTSIRVAWAAVGFPGLLQMTLGIPSHS